MSLSYPRPIELSPEQIETHAIAKRLGRAVADQHPGVQISEEIAGSAFLLNLTHPAHSWTLQVDRADDDNETTLERKAKRKAMAHYFDVWHHQLVRAIHHTEATRPGGAVMLPDALGSLIEMWRKTKAAGRKVVFIGNGGSSAIAGHMAEDLTKNGEIRAVTFNDPALITCYANDYGWALAYASAIEDHGDAGDMLVAMSSSGKSSSIINTVEQAKKMAMATVTLSGFAPDNDLRTRGALNFWTPSSQYGFVETTHAALLHAALDMHMGWVGQS